jgi:lactoylglutathione lyase
MKIEHVALWTNDLERLKTFYTRYFLGKASDKYKNLKNCFESYFIEFEKGARLEIMSMPSVPPNFGEKGKQYLGYVHIAFSVGSKETVDSLTESLRKDRYEVVSEPRTTGDGYYESCILDPDGNRIEITI